MDFMLESWFTELETDEPLIMDQCDNMDSFAEYLATMGEEFQNCLSSENDSCNSDLIQRIGSTNNLCKSAEVPLPSPQIDNLASRRAKQPKANGLFSNIEQPTSAPFILSFGNSKKAHKSQKKTVEEEAMADMFLNSDEPSPKGGDGTKKGPSRVRPPSQTYDHIIAERKRREQLSQLFASLSAIVPGLKKMDKTSVLGDAIKYLKQLQERVKKLEEQSTMQTMESVVLVRRSQLPVDKDEGEDSSDEDPAGGTEDPLPEIEASVCGKCVLIRIHCEKHKGVLLNILSEVEKLHLIVINTNVATFGSLTFEITIVAEMEEEYSSTTKGLLRTLRSALLRVNNSVI